MGTLHFSLCYDHIDPKIICEAIRQLGFPADLADLLQEVWTNIERYVIDEGECSKESFKAGQMIMQGDSFGPFALHVLMAAGVLWVKEQAAQRDWKGLVYMDDRNLVATTARRLCQLVTAWQRWSSMMGLLENAKKTRLVATTKTKERELNEVAKEFGMEQFITKEAEVLGVVTRVSNRTMDDKEKGRVEKALRISRRTRVLPVDRNRRRMAHKMFATSVLAYGWVAKRWTRSDNRKPWSSALEAVHKDACKAGSRKLKAVWEGGQLDPYCIIGVRNLSAAARAVQRGDLKWTSQLGTLSSAVRKFMEETG